MTEITTGERLMKVETEVQALKGRNSDEHKELKEMIQRFIDTADKKYANKWTERISYFTIVTIISVLVTKIFGLW